MSTVTAPRPPVDGTGPRVRVALVNDYEIIARGLVELLSPYADLLEVVDVSLGDEPDRYVHVALFDTFGHRELGLDRVAALVADPAVGRIAVFSAATAPHLVEKAMAAGADAYLPKWLSGAELADALVLVAAGKRVMLGTVRRPRAPNWPGSGHGLTERESELLALVAMGLRNDEIAQALYVSANTVKSHLKSVFRKLGVRNRAEAAVAVATDPTFGRRRVAAHTVPGTVAAS